MPKPPARSAVLSKKMMAWSFSRLNDYRKCPKYAFFKHVQRLAEPGSPALDRGTDVHEQAQVFSQRSRSAKCPQDLATFEDEFRVLQANRKTLAVEQQWCVNEKWEATGWFDRDAWLRVVVDACYVREDGMLVIIDYKTGKIRPEHEEQLSLYAAVGLCVRPDIDKAVVELWYLDHGVQKPDEATVYERKQLPKLIQEWKGKSRPMLADGAFRERPGKACTWCHYSKGKGGPCKF